MTETMKDFLKAFNLSKEYDIESAFRVAIQTMTEEGGAICVVYLKDSKAPVKGGLLTNKRQLEELKELGVLDES